MAENYPEENLSSISKILKALNSTAHDPNNYSIQVEHQLLKFDEEKKSQPGWLLFFRHKKLAPDLLKQIAKKSGLSERQLIQLVKCKILFVDESGRPNLNTDRKHIFSQKKALFYLIFLSMICGFLIAKILYYPHINFQSWITYLCVGYALGNFFGYVLQRSFKAYPLIIELQKLRPWLKINESCC